MLNIIPEEMQIHLKDIVLKSLKTA